MTARRAATFLATLGVLVMSSGVALMVAATPANADPVQKWFVCKYVKTPGGGSELLQGGGNPLSVPATTLDGTPGAGEWIPFADGQHLSYVIEEDTGQDEPDVSECPPSDPGDTLTTASVVFTDPTCENENVASYVANGGEGVTFDSPVAAPGASITVTATVAEGFYVDGPTTFDHTFAAAEADCDVVIVSPPDDDVVVAGPTTNTPKAAVTPTVVSAGLGEVSSDLRGEQGLALIFAGMVLMVAAGGLGLRGRTSRI
jgi:hypothetical protein